MKDLAYDAWAYTKAVFWDGLQKLFTLFDVLGVIAYFFPALVNQAGLGGLSIRTVGMSMIGVSFVLANFSLYRKSAKRSEVGFEIIKTSRGSMRDDIISWRPNQVSFVDDFDVTVMAQANISNSGPVTSVMAFVESVDPNFLREGVSPSGIEVALYDEPLPHYQQQQLHNPLPLNVNEMRIVQLRMTFPFSTALVERQLRCMAAFTGLSVVIGLKPTGMKPIYRTIHCDLIPAHREVEKRVTTVLQHLQVQQIPADQLMGALKRYWGVGLDAR